VGRRIEPVSQADLAKLKGCSRQYVSKAAKGPLAIARLADGTFDKAHPVIVEWLRSASDRSPTVPEKSARKAPPAPTAPRKRTQSSEATPTASEHIDPASDILPDDGTAGAISALVEMPFGELVKTYGTARGFKLWTDSLKDRKTRIAKDEAEELSVRREAIQIFVFGALESTNRRLLRDVPKTLATRLMSLVKSGGTLEESEKLIRDSISTGLSEVKATALRVLKKEPKKEEPKKEP
jgi:hypothetical protein